MDQIVIHGNDLKSLLLLKYLIGRGVHATAHAPVKFNFDSSYEWEGHVFDCGYHAVEINRDAEVWDLISSEELVFHQQVARRVLFINNRLVTRNYSIFDLFDSELTARYTKSESESFEYFSRAYVEDSFVKSYAQNLIWRDVLRLPPQQYLVNIQPWLYPRQFIKYLDGEINYHFENANNSDKSIAYPVEGGFGGIQSSLRRSLSSHINISPSRNSGAKTTQELNVLDSVAGDSNSHHIVSVDLISILSEKNVSVAACLTSFFIVDVQLEREVDIAWTEMLVADPAICIDRISSNDVLAGRGFSKFFQIESEFIESNNQDEVAHRIVSDFSRILRSMGLEVGVESFQYKSFPFRRFDNIRCHAQVSNLLAELESEYRNLTILNRSLLYRNFVDTFRDLKGELQKRVNL